MKDKILFPSYPPKITACTTPHSIKTYKEARGGKSNIELDTEIALSSRLPTSLLSCLLDFLILNDFSRQKKPHINREDPAIQLRHTIYRKSSVIRPPSTYHIRPQCQHSRSMSAVASDIFPSLIHVCDEPDIIDEEVEIDLCSMMNRYGRRST